MAVAVPNVEKRKQVSYVSREAIIVNEDIIFDPTVSLVCCRFLESTIGLIMLIGIRLETAPNDFTQRWFEFEAPGPPLGCRGRFPFLISEKSVQNASVEMSEHNGHCEKEPNGDCGLVQFLKKRRGGPITRKRERSSPFISKTAAQLNSFTNSIKSQDQFVMFGSDLYRCTSSN